MPQLKTLQKVSYPTQRKKANTPIITSDLIYPSPLASPATAAAHLLQLHHSCCSLGAIGTGPPGPLTGSPCHLVSVSCCLSGSLPSLLRALLLSSSPKAFTDDPLKITPPPLKFPKPPPCFIFLHSPSHMIPIARLFCVRSVCLLSLEWQFHAGRDLPFYVTTPSVLRTELELNNMCWMAMLAEHCFH